MTSIMDNQVIINVGGTKFVTVASTLKNVPDTRLASLDDDDEAYDRRTGEYFYDRNPVFFASIIDFYRTGELHFSHCLCGPSVKKELDFWGVDENCMSPCCWKAYQKHSDEQNTIQELARTLGVSLKSQIAQCGPPDSSGLPVAEERESGSCWRTSFKKKMWQFLEKPQSSPAAQMWAITFFILILTSITVVVMETHPVFRVSKSFYNESTIANETNDKLILYATTDLHPVLVYIDGVCISIFTLELTLRFLCCPSKRKFFKSPFNIIDLFCVLPLMVVYIVQTVDGNVWQDTQFFVIIAYLSLSSVLRVFRLFKLARHYRGLKILQLAVRSSLRELVLLFMLIFMGMLIFSTLIYFAEFDQTHDDFPNIPMGFWWSIITMTTVGYGDKYPHAGLGYVVGALCAISGMLITGLPIPIIASNFNHFYNYAALAVKMSQKPSPHQRWIGTSGNNIWKRPNRGRTLSISPSSSSLVSTSLSPNNTPLCQTPIIRTSSVHHNVNVYSSQTTSRPSVRLHTRSPIRTITRLDQEYCSKCSGGYGSASFANRGSRWLKDADFQINGGPPPINTTEA